MNFVFRKFLNHNFDSCCYIVFICRREFPYIYTFWKNIVEMQILQMLLCTCIINNECSISFIKWSEGIVDLTRNELTIKNEPVENIVLLILIHFFLNKWFNLFSLGPQLHQGWHSLSNQLSPVLVTIIVALCLSLLLNVLLIFR